MMLAQQKPYSADRESLIIIIIVPDWAQDAKFGIICTLGGLRTWYSRIHHRKPNWGNYYSTSIQRVLF